MLEVKEKFKGKVNGRPEFQDRKEMWESLTIEQVLPNSHSIEEYLESLSTFYCDVKFGSFILGKSEVLDWYGSRGLLRQMLFFFYLFKNKSIASYFKIDVDSIDEKTNQYFDRVSPFSLAGTLASIIHSGGAYDRPQWSSVHSMDLSMKASLEFLDNNYDDTLVYETNFGWCDFFNHAAWDYSFVILNKRTRRLNIFLTSDTS